jgi:hypothetical protein
MWQSTKVQSDGGSDPAVIGYYTFSVFIDAYTFNRFTIAFFTSNYIGFRLLYNNSALFLIVRSAFTLIKHY